MAHNPFRSVRFVAFTDEALHRVLALELLKSRPGSVPRLLLLDADGRAIAGQVKAGELPVGLFCDWLEDNAGTLPAPRAAEVLAAASALRLRGGFFAGPRRKVARVIGGKP